MSLQLNASLQQCLAYAVLTQPRAWLGDASPGHLEALLIGAEHRASLTRTPFPAWRIAGPLNQPEFHLPIVARTGHPSLACRWAAALEILHLSLEDGVRELLTLFEGWAELHGIEAPEMLALHEETTLAQHLQRFMRSPAMYMGRCNGWSLRCYLEGMSRGGDWLGLPKLEGLQSAIQGIEQRSLVSYGSHFGAYRVYQDLPAELLHWAALGAESA